MESSVKKLDKCQVELSVTLSAEEVGSVVKAVERDFVKEARLPGFRPGKAPIALLKREFPQQFEAATKEGVVRKYYHDAVKQAELKEVALTGVKAAETSAAGGSFTVTVDVQPEFKLPTYKGLKIAAADVTVKDDEVMAEIERMRAGFAKYEDAKDGEAVAAGDFVQIDYAGTVDGKPILELAPEAKVVANATGFWTQVAEGRFLKEILDALVGMKAGETKQGVVAKFDTEAAPEPLKGKTAKYDLTLKAFRRQVKPTDAELAEQVKVESYEKLVADLRAALEKRAVERESARRENEAVELLLKKVDFAVPPSQVERARDAYLAQLAKRAEMAGIGAEYFEKNRDKILEDAETNAERQVRLWYLIDAIAEAEKLEATDEERGKKVIEFILANSKH